MANYYKWHQKPIRKIRKPAKNAGAFKIQTRAKDQRTLVGAVVTGPVHPSRGPWGFL